MNETDAFRCKTGSTPEKDENIEIKRKGERK